MHRVAGAVVAMATACGGLRFLGDFRVEVVAAREELVIAQEVERLLRG